MNVSSPRPSRRRVLQTASAGAFLALHALTLATSAALAAVASAQLRQVPHELTATEANRV